MAKKQTKNQYTWGSEGDDFYINDSPGTVEDVIEAVTVEAENEASVSTFEDRSDYIIYELVPRKRVRRASVVVEDI